jgi:hypothetical protein
MAVPAILDLYENTFAFHALYNGFAAIYTNPAFGQMGF